MSPTVAKLLSVALGVTCLVAAYFTQSNEAVSGLLLLTGGGLLGYPLPAPGAKK